MQLQQVHVTLRAQTGEESKVKLEMAEGGGMVADKNDKDFRKVHHWTWSLAGKTKQVYPVGMWNLLSAAQLWFSGLRADWHKPSSDCALWIEHCMNKPN